MTRRFTMMSKKTLRALFVSLILILVLTQTVFADKPGPGTSTGTGQGFFPNPVAYLQDQSLTDQKDATYPALGPAYVSVTLTTLDGSGYLVGDWATITRKD